MRRDKKLTPGGRERRSRVYGGAKRITGRRKKKEKRERVKTITRGQEISIREPAGTWDVVYGQVRMGGTYTFVDFGPTQASAMLTTGSGNSRIAWIANTPGEDGNNITVTIQLSGTHGSLDVTVDGTDITVRLMSNAGESLSTANQVINAVRASVEASALVSVNRGGGNGRGIVTNQARTNLSGGGGLWLHAVHTLACHEIEAINQMYIDGERVEFGASPDPRWATGRFLNCVFLAWQSGTEDQEVQPDLHAQIPSKWTVDHRQRGLAHAYVILKYKESVFPNGLPEVAFDVAGRKVYDPRDPAQDPNDPSTWVWSNNAALCIADYLTNSKFGCGYSYSDLNEENLIEAANICDEQVVLADGSSESRYTINGTFKTSLDPLEVLEEMATAIAGSIVYQGGQWHIFPGAWRTPTVTLTEDNLRGPVEIETRNSRRDLFNAVKGTFLDAKNNYTESDFPTVKNAMYIAEDGGEIKYLDISYSLVTSGAAAQRIAKIELEEARQGITVRMPVDLGGYRLQVEDNVYLTLARYGWTQKPFRVIDIVLAIKDNGEGDLTIETELVLEETAEGIYDWNNGEETTIDLAPNTGFQNPYEVLAPTDVAVASGTEHLFVQNDGTIVPRLYVSWVLPEDIFVQEGGYYQIEYKRSADANWHPAPAQPRGSASFAYLTGVSDGEVWDVRIRSVNGFGVQSDWVEVLNHTVVGKSEPPSDVPSVSTSVDSFGITIEWVEISDADLAEYEVRLGSDFDSGTPVARGRATTIRLPIRTAGSYTFFVKAIDTSGNYSTNATSATAVISAPNAPVPSVSFEQNQAVLAWTIPSSQFAIDEYEIRYGASFATGTPLGSTKGTTFRLIAQWSGVRKFWIAARDVAGNVGTAASVDVTVAAPGQVGNLQADVIDNNVLLRWTPTTGGTLPIGQYNIYKGDTFDSATLIGNVTGSFSAILEMISGTYTYWVEAQDTAGNTGLPSSVTAMVNQPPHFQLLSDQILDPAQAEELINVVVVG